MNVYGPVGVDGDDDRDDQALVLRGLRVEVLAEVHDIQAVRTERGPDRRRGGCLPRRDLELHHCRNFFSHDLTRCQLPAPAASGQLEPAVLSWELEAGSWKLQFLDLQEIQFDRCRPAEDGHHDLERVAIEVDLVHRAVEAGERALVDPDLVALFEGVFGFGFSAASVT